jgi:hypothetical protein
MVELLVTADCVILEDQALIALGVLSSDCSATRSEGKNHAKFFMFCSIAFGHEHTICVKSAQRTAKTKH